MTDSLTTRMIVASGLPMEIETLSELAYYLRKSAAHAKRVESHVNSTIEKLWDILRQANVPLEAVEVKRHEPRFRARLLTIAELQKELGISRGTLTKVRKSPGFPKPLRLSNRRLAYVSSEIRDWVTRGGLGAERTHATDQAP